MKTKLLLWFALSAMVAALMLAIVAAAFRNGEAAIYLGAAAGFFAFMAAVLAGDLDRWHVQLALNARAELRYYAGR